TPSNNDTFRIIHPTNATPWMDSYKVRLTAQPNAAVDVRITPAQTLTTDHRQPDNGQRNNVQVTVETCITDPSTGNTTCTRTTGNVGDSIVLHFTTTNWFVEQTVNVYAIDDSVVDGNDTQAFADQPELLSR